MAATKGSHLPGLVKLSEGRPYLRPWATCEQALNKASHCFWSRAGPVSYVLVEGRRGNRLARPPVSGWLLRNSAPNPAAFTFRQPVEQLRRRLRRNARAAKHGDGVGVGFGLVARACRTKRHELLGIGADAAGEQADQRADAELADQGLGDVAAADVGDLVRDDPGQLVGLVSLA